MNIYELIQNNHIPTVKQIVATDIDIQRFVDETRAMTGIEGFMFVFLGGHRVKCKGDWYVNLHRTLDEIRQDRHIIALELNEQTDDLLPKLQPADRARVIETTVNFWTRFNNKLAALDRLATRAETVYQMDRKRIALEMVPTLNNSEDKHFIFAVANGRNLHQELLNKCKDSLGSGVKYDALTAWLDSV